MFLSGLTGVYQESEQERSKKERRGHFSWMDLTPVCGVY